jgi:hypothetical protein
MPNVQVTIINEVVEVVQVDDTSQSVEIVEQVVEVVNVAEQGPPGPQGEQGGDVPAPTFPVVDPKSSADLAAGASVNLDSEIISNGVTGKVQQITLSSSAPCKWVLKKSSGGVDTTLDTIFTSGNTGQSPSHEWEPPHRDYTDLTGNGVNTFYRVTATQLDAKNAANVYVTFFFDEVT